MTLADYVLDTIETEWPDGSLPDDLHLIQRDDAVIRGSGRALDADLSKGNYVGAALSRIDPEPNGVRAEPALEATVAVRIDGMHESEHGYITDYAEFQTLVENVKAALRVQRYQPNVGDAHPGTFVKLELANDEDVSDEYQDHYGRLFDVQLTGHR